MLNNITARLFHSVFLKLLLLIIASGVFINLAVGVFFMYLYKGSTSDSPFRRNTGQYIRYLINDLGTPPTIEKAREISRHLSIDIRYESPSDTWSTSPDLPPIESMRLKEFHNQARIFIARYQGKRFLVAENPSGPGRYALDFIRSDSRQTFMERKILLLICLLTIILVVVYFIIRRILKPITLLTGGVNELGNGNLDFQIPVDKADELGTLSRAFNDMAARIRNMLHAKEQLLLDVSHELRSPLTRIRVALEFLPDSATKTSINEDIVSMDSMIEELLESHRIKSPYGKLNLENCTLRDLAQEAIAFFQNQSPGIVLEPESETAEVMIDGRRVLTVLKNCLDNAVKNSSESSGPIRVVISTTGEDLAVRIHDSGTGIPPEDLPHIFEPFYRVDKSRNKITGGYGLGLNLCKTIMEAHGGTISIVSQPGRGTTVTLRFPKQKKDA